MLPLVILKCITSAFLFDWQCEECAKSSRELGNLHLMLVAEVLKDFQFRNYFVVQEMTKNLFCSNIKFFVFNIRLQLLCCQLFVREVSGKSFNKIEGCLPVTGNV